MLAMETVPIPELLLVPDSLVANTVELFSETALVDVLLLGLDLFAIFVHWNVELVIHRWSVDNAFVFANLDGLETSVTSMY